MKRYACIFIGTNRCSLRVAQRAGSGRVNILERAEYPVDFSSRIFKGERAKEKSVSEVGKIIKEYTTIAEQTSADEIEIYLSAALRRAIDSIYIYERVKLAAHPYPVHIITNDEEIDNFCREMMSEVTEFMEPEELKKDALFLNLKSDSTLLAFLKEGYVQYETSMPLGYAKLSAMMEGIIEESETFTRLMTEIITNHLMIVRDTIGKRSYEHIFISSIDYPGILKLAGEDRPVEEYLHCSKKRIGELYQGVKDLTPKQLSRKYTMLNLRESDTVQLTLVFCRAVLEVFGCDNLYLLPFDIAGGLASFKFRNTMTGQLDAWIDKSGYLCAKREAERFNVDLVHAENVEFFALRFFDTLRRRFGFTKRARHLLKMASLLVTAGDYFGTQSRIAAGAFIAEHARIIGLSQKERDILSKIIQHTTETEYRGLPADLDLTEEEQLLMAQLTALLKLASALDASHKQKVQNLHCQLGENTFTVRGSTSKNVGLEQYEFQAEKACFESVFGLEAELKIKRVKL